MIVGLLGGGVIGAGWAARFALNGHDVRLYDPDPDAERKVGEVVANARRAMRKLVMPALPAEGSISVVGSPDDAAHGSRFIQESAPERLDVKRELLQRASRAAPAEVVIASSTSGLLPTSLQDGMSHPERFVVGHPFNPVYLLPLVEVCGGARTAPATVAAAADLYRGVGMQPLVLGKEIDGFVADRLLEALWREALWLVNDGVATAEEIDDAIRFGAGLRWSFMGTFLTYRIAGGEAGMRHFMEQFGPALKWPWTKLTDVPDLTDALLDRLVAQSDQQAGGRSIRALEVMRDDCLVAVMQGLRSAAPGGVAAGAVLDRYERQLFGATPAPPVDLDAPAPVVAHEVRVPAEWTDYNGHLNDSRYLRIASEACDRFLRLIGVDAQYLADGHSYYTAECHLAYAAAARGGDVVRATAQLLHHDPKRIHLFIALWRGGDQLATAELMLLHVDTAESRACAADPTVLSTLERLAAAHSALPTPRQAGRSVGQPKSI
jgi:carnitine 3-dehydrogenase